MVAVVVLMSLVSKIKCNTTPPPKKKKNLKNSVDLNQNDGGSLELIKNFYRLTLITLTVDLKFVCVLYHL